MINSIIRYTGIFVLLILLQILLFNNIMFSGYINPYIYILIILLLPVEIPSWLLLIISFITGMIIDIFSGTIGMHTSSTVLAGFIRPYVLRIMAPRDGYEAGDSPSMALYGVRWFFIYTLIIVSIHHLSLFYLEVFSFTDFFRTLLRVVLSSGFSIVFILLLEYYRKSG
jgi:rod shape-determining protein MreD